MKDVRFENIKQALKNNENQEEALALAKTLNSNDLKELPLYRVPRINQSNLLGRIQSTTK